MSDRLVAALRELLAGTENVTLLWGFRPLRVILLPDTSGLAWSAGLTLEATVPPFARYVFAAPDTVLAPGVWIYTPCEPLTDEERADLVSLFVAEERKLGLVPQEISCPTYRQWVLEGPVALFPASVLESYTADRVLAEVKLRAEALAIQDLDAHAPDPIAWATAELQRFQRLDTIIAQVVNQTTLGMRTLPTHRELAAFRQSYMDMLRSRLPLPSPPASSGLPEPPQPRPGSGGVVLQLVLVLVILLGSLILLAVGWRV